MTEIVVTVTTSFITEDNIKKGDHITAEEEIERILDKASDLLGDKGYNVTFTISGQNYTKIWPMEGHPDLEV